MMNKFIIKFHLHHQQQMKVIIFLFQVGARRWYLAWVRLKLIQRGRF